jgi:hypothetical protein
MAAANPITTQGSAAVIKSYIWYPPFMLRPRNSSNSVSQWCEQFYMKIYMKI